MPGITSIYNEIQICVTIGFYMIQNWGILELQEPGCHLVGVLCEL